MFWKRSRNRQRAILMVDVVGSTALYERLGDELASQLVTERLDEVGLAIGAEHGRVVKSLGDGLLCCFDKPADAFRAVTGLVIAPTGEVARSLSLRVAVHYGTVVEQKGDVFGDAVNTVARLVHVARPSEVLLSRALVDALPARVTSLLQEMPPVSLKGKSEPLELYSLRGSFGDSGTHTMTLQNEPRASGIATLELTHGERRWSLGPGEHRLVVGRDSECDVTLEGDVVSRQHLTIERRADRLVLIDESINGTWLAPDGQGAVRLLREETRLHGRGELCLGAAPGSNGSAPVLRYEVGEVQTR